MRQTFVLIHEDEIELALASFYETLAKKRKALDACVTAGVKFELKDFGIPHQTVSGG